MGTDRPETSVAPDTPMDALLLFRALRRAMSLWVLEDLRRRWEPEKKTDAVALRKRERILSAGASLHEIGQRDPGAETPWWRGGWCAFYREMRPEEAAAAHGLLEYGDLQMEALRLFSIPDVADRSVSAIAKSRCEFSGY